MKAEAIRLVSNAKNSGAGILLPKSAKTPTATGLVVKKPTQTQVSQLNKELGTAADALDTTKLYTLDALSGRLAGITFTTKALTAAVLLPAAAKGGSRTLTIVQEDQAGNVAGGSTFAVRASG